jgi:hypothetical protein
MLMVGDPTIIVFEVVYVYGHSLPNGKNFVFASPSLIFAILAFWFFSSFFHHGKGDDFSL